MNYDALEEHFRYKETSFKHEKENFERQLMMIREDYEEKVGSHHRATVSTAVEEGIEHDPRPARHLRLPERQVHSGQT